MTTKTLEWNRTVSRPRGTTLSCRGCLVLCWIACLLVTLPADQSVQGVCNRTLQVLDEILEQVRRRSGGRNPVRGYADVTTVHLASVTLICLAQANITVLQGNDFSGLISLEQMTLYGNSLTTFPEGVFQELGKLDLLDLWGNPFRELAEGFFRELDSLEWH